MEEQQEQREKQEEQVEQLGQECQKENNRTRWRSGGGEKEAMGKEEEKK